MADQVTCPLCGLHPVSDDYCPTLLTEIPPGLLSADSGGSSPDEPSLGAASPGADSPGEPPRDDSARRADDTRIQEPPARGPAAPAGPAPARAPADRAVCPVCGCPGSPGEECMQCGRALPPPAAAAGTALVLPSGDRVSIPRGRELVVGRLSDTPGIRRALHDYDAVSRRHCLITVEPDGARVRVRDPGSANGTWLGDDPAQIRPGETRTAALPVRLRLGLNLSITISA